MNGHGSPISAIPPHHIGARQLAAALIFVGSCAFVSAAEQDIVNLRLQIAWGGGATARLWKGSISVDGGTVSNIQLLGLDADQPGSFVEQNGRVLVYPRLASQTSGLLLDASGPIDSNLEIMLTADDVESAPSAILIPLVDLRNDFEGKQRILGDDHKLRVARAAGDQLRVKFSGDSMVFTPNERVRMTVTPHELGAKPGSVLRARLRVRRVEARRNEVTDLWPIDSDFWSRDEILKVDDNRRVRPLRDIELPIPGEEGVYDLTIELDRSLPRVGTVARRKVQFIVVDPRQPPLFGGGPPTTVAEFNPADPKWFERLPQLPQWALLQPAKRGSWSNLPTEVFDDQEKLWTRIASTGWVAYSLPIDDVGVPHVLELELPANYRQDIGISIVDREGEHSPESLDFGATIGEPDAGVSPMALPEAGATHRLVFWPKSRSTVLLISNAQRDRSALFGRIRIESFKHGLPVADVTPTGSRRRLAVLDCARLKEVFLARNAYDADTETPFDDWQTFYQAGTRLIAYLRHAGYDGVALTVAAHGSSLYPSRYLNPTARYDRGVFSSAAQDPVRKDVVEMLLRMFDREGLDFIPRLEFATPLPELERMLASDEEHTGIELVDHEGTLGSTLSVDSPRGAPFYNPLDPRVQAEIARVVQEVVTRYRNHESFAGISLPLLPNGYTQLPDAGWGFDPRTLQTFVESVRSSTDADVKTLSAQLRQELGSSQPTPLKHRWLTWRAGRLNQFYKQLAELVHDESSGDLLYLPLANLMEATPLQRQLRPTLSRKPTATEALLEVGLEMQSLATDPRLVVLRPQRLAPLSNLAAAAMNLDIEDPEVRTMTTDGFAAAEFYHHPVKVSYDLLDERGPPLARGKPTAELHLARTGIAARRPFARGLATHDDRLIFDGGSTVSMGQEADLNDFFAVFRQLPDRPFETLQLDGAAPLVIRTTSSQMETYLYAVNNSPWPTRATMRWQVPRGCVVNALGPTTVEASEQGEHTTVEMTVEPFGLVAFKFSSPHVKALACQSQLPSAVAKHLKVRLDEVVSRVNQVGEDMGAAPILLDPGFERPLSSTFEAPWTISQWADGTAEIDTDNRASGNSSLHLQANGGIVAATSNTFAIPETGRLVLTMKLRSAEPAVDPVKVSLQSSDPKYNQVFRLRNLTTEFKTVVIPVLELPFDPNLKFRISIEVREGEVWVDDVQHSWFLSEDKKAFRKILLSAIDPQGNRDLAKCYETLNGYWPRFLLRHVPRIEVAARPIPAGSAPRSNQEPSPRRFLDKVKDFVLRK